MSPSTRLNPYYDDSASINDRAPTATFDILVVENMAIIGLDPGNVNHQLIIRYILFKHPSNTSAMRYCVQEVFGQCLPDMEMMNQVLTTGRTTYSDAVFGTFTEEQTEEGEGAWRDFQAELGTSHKHRIRYESPENVAKISAVLARVMATFAISPKQLYTATRNQGNEPIYKAPLALRVGLSIEFKIDAKAVSHILDKVLNTESRFENHSDLTDMINEMKKAVGKVSLGSRSGLQREPNPWANSLDEWLEEVKKDMNLRPGELPVLLAKPSQDEEDPRRPIIMEMLRKKASKAGFPRVHKLALYVERTFDPHAGQGLFRKLTEEQKESILWWMGQADNRPGGILIASDAVGLPYHKIENFASSLKGNLKREIEKILEQYGDEEP